GRTRRAHGPPRLRAAGGRLARPRAGDGRRRMTPETRAALEAGLGHRFIRPDRLAVALTHRSFGVDTPNNEKLEFLGDAVLALAMSDLLMARFPEASEGELSKIRASLVNADVLARKARELDVGSALRCANGEEKSGRREKLSILAAAASARGRRLPSRPRRAKRSPPSSGNTRTACDNARGAGRPRRRRARGRRSGARGAAAAAPGEHAAGAGRHGGWRAGAGRATS